MVQNKFLTNLKFSINIWKEDYEQGETKSNWTMSVLQSAQNNVLDAMLSGHNFTGSFESIWGTIVCATFRLRI